MWSVSCLGRQPPQQTRLSERWEDGWNLVTWTLECLLWCWDWTVLEVQIWSHWITFFSVFVHPCHCRPSYSNERALMLDWKINWMDIKEGLNPAVNVWALGCQDNTADSALKPLQAFCLWVVFMTGSIFHLGLDRAARVTVAVNLTLICLLFVWCVQGRRSSRSDFSP